MSTVYSLSKIDIDGVAWSVADAFRNLPDLTAEIFDALIAWESGIADRALATQTAALAEAAKHHEAAMNDLTAERDAVQADNARLTTLAEEYGKQVGTARGIIEKQVAEVTNLRSQLEFQATRGNKAMELVNHLIGDQSEAAVAVTRELQRLDLARQQAALAATEAALSAS